MSWARYGVVSFIFVLAAAFLPSCLSALPSALNLSAPLAVAALDRGQLIVRSWRLGEALCGAQESPLSLGWGNPCYKVDVTLAFTPQEQENYTVVYNAYIQTTQSGWDQWKQASDAGTSWRLQALAYVWTIAAVVTATVWLLFVVYSSITWPPSFFQFTQTTLVVMAAIFYLVLFLYDEATDWVFIWSVTDSGSILAVFILCWVKFGRSFLGMVALLIACFRLRGARLLVMLLCVLYVIWLVFLIVMTVEIAKVGIETYIFCRDDAIFVFGFAASLSLLFSLLLAAILLYQSVTIAIGTRRRRTAFIALQLFMAVLQFGPMAFLQSLLWWQGWGLVTTTIMVLSVSSSVVGLTGTLLSLLLVLAKAYCCRGAAPVTWHQRGEEGGDKADGGGGSLEHGTSKVAPEPGGGSVTDSAMRAIERSKSSFGYDPLDPRGSPLKAPPQQSMTDSEVARMQALLGSAAASSPPAPWQQRLPWQHQQQRSDASGRELSLASARHSDVEEHSLKQDSFSHPLERSSPASVRPAQPDEHTWQYGVPVTPDDPRRQYKPPRRPAHQYKDWRHAPIEAKQERRYGGWQRQDSLLPYGLPSLRAALPPHAGNPRPLPRYDILLSRTVINAYTQGYQEGLDATIQKRIKP